MVNYKFIFFIFTIYYYIAIEAAYNVTLLTPQNVQRGSTIAINWTFSGIQTTPVELRINNTRTSSITVIDTNVDLTKESEIWTVTVDAGNYVLFLLDKTFYTSAYSNVFTVSQVKAYYANSQTGYANSQTNYANSQTNYTNSQTEDSSKAGIIIVYVIISILSLLFIIFLLYGCCRTEYKVSFFFKYLLAYIFPPLCVILIFTGDRLDGIIFHTVISLIGTLAYIPGVIHALFWVFHEIEHK
ncbi:hypothetical protein C2G38_2141612 [Gigaspora rosea]|uniref:Uncharacterized protein n=1 Tax=Gigaspora rosea TaxID=44941 RepID=A0A397VJW4_9GLOM|nr:hypothetical protein C2G38_2141612 [Gigaspora rosea]